MGLAGRSQVNADWVVEKDRKANDKEESQSFAFHFTSLFWPLELLSRSVFLSCSFLLGFVTFTFNLTPVGIPYCCCLTPQNETGHRDGVARMYLQYREIVKAMGEKEKEENGNKEK